MLPSLREYFRVFGMTEARMHLAKPDVMIMHPGPMNRGVEIASEVADGPYQSSSTRWPTASRCAWRFCTCWRAERNMKRLLKGGRVIDPANGIDGVHDVLIEDGRIARGGSDLPVEGATVVEIPSGLVVCPGLIDMHVHLREPVRNTRRRWRRVWPRRWPVVSRRSRACRTHLRSTTTPTSRR